MKIALLTANIGGIDEIHAPAKQKESYDFFYLTEKTLLFPLPNLDTRTKGKYFPGPWPVLIHPPSSTRHWTDRMPWISWNNGSIVLT